MAQEVGKKPAKCPWIKKVSVSWLRYTNIVLQYPSLQRNEYDEIFPILYTRIYSY